MKLLKLAWRNIWRNRRRTVATMMAMTLALLVTATYSGLVEGYLRNMERDALENEVSSVQVSAPGYQDHPSIYTAIENDNAILQRLAAAGLPAAPRFLAGGLAAARESSAGVLFRGVDVAKDAAVVRLQEQVLEGKWLDPADMKGVVLGRKLAHTLDVKPGDELILLSQAADGSMANALFTVVGVLRSVGEATDRAGVFMTAAQFRDFLGYQGGAHQLLIRRPEATPLEVMERQVQQAASGMEVQTWRRLLPTLATVLDATRGMVGMLTFIIYVVVSIVVLNAMLMAVFERIREFGILKALGIHPYDVVKLIILEAMLQVVLSIILGLLLCIPVLGYLVNVGVDTGALSGVSLMGMAMSARWYAIIGPSTFVTPVVMLLIMGLLAVLYPALKAAWLRPVEAMRHQ